MNDEPYMSVPVREFEKLAQKAKEADRLREALDWIEAEPEDPVKVQLWARAALER